MQKQRRRELYRALTRTLGNPAVMTNTQREDVRHVLDGWRGQYTKAQPLDYRARINLSSPRQHGPPTQDSLATEGWLGRYLREAGRAFHTTRPPSHWDFRSICCVPPVVAQNKARWHLGKMEVTTNWSHTSVPHRKCVVLAISPSYHLTVAKQGVARDGRKIVQAIWDHRDFEDIQVWQCRYWDFSCINHDEHSWKAATQQQGYVAKTSTHVSVDKDFGKAMAGVKRRTVGHAIRSIIKDYSDE